MNDVELLGKALLNMSSSNSEYILNEKINLVYDEKYTFNKPLKDYKLIFLIIAFSNNSTTPSEKTKTTVCFINNNYPYLSSSVNQMYLNKKFTQNYSARFSIHFTNNYFVYNGFFDSDDSTIIKEGRVFIESGVGIF